MKTPRRLSSTLLVRADTLAHHRSLSTQANRHSVSKTTPHRSPLSSLKRSYAHRGSSLLFRGAKIPCHHTPKLASAIVSPSSDEEEQRDYESDSSTSCSSSYSSPDAKTAALKTRKRPLHTARFVHFAPTPLVVEIPSHRSYPNKSEIWNSPQVLREQAKRNRKEWAWEKGRVDCVAEEDAFRRDDTGKLVHPMHFPRS